MTASKRRNHPSILQVPSISSLFSVLPRVILGKTQRNKTCQSSAISLHNQPISREYLLSSSTSFPNIIPKHHSQTPFWNIILKPTITTDHLTREQGKEAPLWKVLTHRPRWQWTRGWHQVPWVLRSSYQMQIYEDHLMIMYIAMTISFSALQTGKPEWREPRSTSPFLPSRSV